MMSTTVCLITATANSLSDAANSVVIWTIITAVSESLGAIFAGLALFIAVREFAKNNTHMLKILFCFFKPGNPKDHQVGQLYRANNDFFPIFHALRLEFEIHNKSKINTIITGAYLQMSYKRLHMLVPFCVKETRRKVVLDTHSMNWNPNSELTEYNLESQSVASMEVDIDKLKQTMNEDDPFFCLHNTQASSMCTF